MHHVGIALHDHVLCQGDRAGFCYAAYIVPTKVERVALQNAASISGLLLTTDCAITEIKEGKEPAAAGGGMDDMDF